MKHNSLMSLTEDNSHNKGMIKDHIFLKNIDKFEKVFWSEISYIESQKNYLFIHTSQIEYKHRATIKDFIKVLPNQNFVQVHRAFIINSDKIRTYNKAEMIVEVDQSIIPISKSYKANLLSVLE